MTSVGVRKQQAALTEAELKSAAIRVFDRVGYLNAKITDITAEAGRATGSFYKHFASKEKLLEALLGDLLEEGDASAELPGHGTDFRDREAVRWHIAVYWGFYRQTRTVMTALQQAASVDETFAAQAQRMIEPDLHHIAGHLAGLDLPGDPLVVAMMFTSLLSTFTATWVSGNYPRLERQLTDDEVIEMLTSFVHAGMAAGERSGVSEPG